MNRQDLKAFIDHNLLQVVEAFPAVGDNSRFYQAVVYIKTATPKFFLPLEFTTDRPFVDQKDVMRYFTSAGVPKHKLHFVFPNSDRYTTAEMMA